MVKRLLEGIHPASLWNRKRQIPLVSKPFMRRSGLKEYIFNGIANLLNFNQFMFSPEQDVLKGTAPSLVSLRKGNLMIGIIDLVIASYPR